MDGYILHHHPTQKSLGQKVSSGNYQDLTLKLGVKGTPYYLSEFDDRIYFTEITESSGVIWFKDTPSDQILEKGKKMDFGEPNNQNILRRSQFPL